jgi:HEPN domain-containing protein
LLADVAYHCQQGTEKALKAFLVWRDSPFRRTHSIEEIGEQCIQKDVTLKDIIDRASPLTEYAWKFRYPGEPEEPTVEEAEEALAAARETFQAVLSRLPVDVRSDLL